MLEILCQIKSNFYQLRRQNASNQTIQEMLRLLNETGCPLKHEFAEELSNPNLPFYVGWPFANHLNLTSMSKFCSLGQHIGKKNTESNGT